MESERFSRAAEGQYRDTVKLPALRGPILDRHGAPIATSTMYVGVEANPRNVDADAAAIARSLSKITGKRPGHYLSLLNRKRDGKKVKYVVLERSLAQGPVREQALDTLKGLSIRDKSRRIHHAGVVAGQLLGMTNDADRGIAGLELGLDSLLKGTDGMAVYQRLGSGPRVPSVDYPRVEPVPGNSAVLTIDLLLQEIAERELERGVKENGAEGGVVVMLRPQTGELLAVAQYPRVNPAEFGKAQKENQKLRAVTDMLEPGSVFKLVTAAAALDHGLIGPDRVFHAENGVYNVYYRGQKRPRTIRDVHRYGNLTFREAMEFSSNIVMAKASDIIGNERLYTTARDFGFGMKTGIDIPAEIGGLLKKPLQWSLPTRHSLSYGYEVGVTPIQVAAAYAAVANGGILMRPYILSKVIAPDGSVVRETEPAPVRRVVSEETAATLTSFLEGVVERGTATSAKVPGLRIAGKTGTSKRLVNGKYEGSEYTASFVGFFPADDPRVVCLVMLDKPKGINYYGGTTSAPIFREIVSRIAASSDGYTLPLADGAREDADGPLAAAEAERAPAPAKKETAGRRTDGERRPAAAKSSSAGNHRHIVPDVLGFSKRKAISLLKDEKFEPVVDGSGVVVSQHPRPGEPVSSSRVIRLTCEPRTVKQGDLR